MEVTEILQNLALQLHSGYNKPLPTHILVTKRALQSLTKTQNQRFMRDIYPASPDNGPFFLNRFFILRAFCKARNLLYYTHLTGVLVESWYLFVMFLRSNKKTDIGYDIYASTQLKNLWCECARVNKKKYQYPECGTGVRTQRRNQHTILYTYTNKVNKKRAQTK